MNKELLFLVYLSPSAAESSSNDLGWRSQQPQCTAFSRVHICVSRRTAHVQMYHGKQQKSTFSN